MPPQNSPCKHTSFFQILGMQQHTIEVEKKVDQIYGWENYLFMEENNNGDSTGP